MATVFLNGRFLERHEATVSAFDAGFQHAVGLFETMLAVRVEDGGGESGGGVGGGGGGGGEGEVGREEGVRVVDLDAHLDRLIRSARTLGLSESIRASALAETVYRTVDKAAAREADQKRFRVRLTITGGDLSMLESRPRDAAEATRQEDARRHGHDPTVMVAVTPATDYPEVMFERGVGVVLADWRANPFDTFQGYKTLNYWPRLRELQMAAGKRAGEALIFSVSNHLAGGCVSNAFVVKDGVVMTPIARGEEEEVVMETEGLDPDSLEGLGDEEVAARLGARQAGKGGGAEAGASGAGGAVLPSPVLAGVTRRWALEYARAQGLETRRQMLNINDVLGADEVFLTNSSWGVLPVVAVESVTIGRGAVGSVTSSLVEAWGTRTR